MKCYILKHKDKRIDGEYLNGITFEKPIVMVDEIETLDSNYVEVEMEETDDRYVNQIFYKVKDNKIVKLSDEEFKVLYPNYDVVVPTDIETLQQENHLLKAQVKALTEQGEFQDELIAEIATVVYA